MIGSRVSQVKKHGALRATFVYLTKGKLQDLFEKCANGQRSQRQGVAKMAAQLLSDDKCRAASCELLIRYLDDPDEKVRLQAREVFRRVSLLGYDNIAAFVERYLGTKSFTDKPTELLRSLDGYKGSLLPFSEAIFRICEQLAGALAPETRGIATQLGFEAGMIPSLLLRVYEQAEGKGLDEVQSKCLDTWDSLLKNRVGDSRQILEGLDA
jgi:hypothetical protein